MIDQSNDALLPGAIPNWTSEVIRSDDKHGGNQGQQWDDWANVCVCMPCTVTEDSPSSFMVALSSNFSLFLSEVHKVLVTII